MHAFLWSIGGEQIVFNAKVFFLGSLFLALIAVGVMFVWFRDCPGVFRRYFHTILLRENDFISADVRFRKEGAGAFISPNGRLGGFTSVRASDCVEVMVESEDEGSPAEAADEMERRIRGAGRVIEQRPVRYGELNGERVVLVAPGDKEIEIIVRYETHPRLGVIRSASLAHALAYEKQIENGYRLELDRDGYVLRPGR
jgi:hypothetical protein